MAHFGFGLFLIGVLASSGFVTSDKLVVPEGGEEVFLDTKIAYEGMEHDIGTINNGILLRLDSDGDITNGKAELYYSERMDGIMRRPYIRRSLTNDLYLAPATIQRARRAEAILRKGESKDFENFTLTFAGFEMGDHGSDNPGGMKILANMTLESPSEQLEISPVFELSDEYGESEMIGRLEKFTIDGREYNVMVEQIFADQGAVGLTLGGLSDEPEVDLLVLDVTHIPLINLVWLGTFLLVIGVFLAFARRRGEVIALDKKELK